MFGFSPYDGYDIYQHLQDGNSASFHHLNFNKKCDDFNNLIFMPKRNKDTTVSYVYHHHPIVKTKKLFDTTIYNMEILEQICLINDFTYSKRLKNWDNDSIKLLKYRMTNDNWIKDIHFFLPRGNYPYKLKDKTLEYFFRKFIHTDFHYRSRILSLDFKKFWKEYLDYRKKLRKNISKC